MKGTDEITNSQNIIDSRQIIKRIDWLQPDRDGLEETAKEAQAEYETACKDPQRSDDWEDLKTAADESQEALNDYDESDEGMELKALKSLAEEAEGYSEDWPDGATLIRDSYFTEYAEELCKDCGDIPKEVPWYVVIDWEATAEHIKQDYTSVDFDGVTYWVR